MEEDDKPTVDFITCAAWVCRGVAKADPDKVEISKEDLARIIKETGGEVKELEELEADYVKKLKKGEEEEDEDDMEVLEDEEGEKDGTGEEVKKVSRKNDDCLDFESRYHMEEYEEEEDEGVNKLLQLGQMALYASSDDDPFITVKDENDADSEPENHAILPSDNLIAVGHVEGDAAILEVYVYNSEQGCLYVHHDMLLPAVPLCMEWLNYDPGDEELKPGNYVAVGTMSPVIEVWDLDLVDSMEPAFRLGKKAKKKKKIPGVGHKDAVLSLAWNKQAEHVLASGSVDQTVILWDLQHGSVAQQLTPFKEKVQSLQWHHNEPHSLLSGSCDKMVRLFDCNASDSCKSWKLDGEVECTVWNTLSERSHEFLASTDKGTVYSFDCRQEKPLWTLNAHSEGCTGIQISPQCPGCLVTVSSDKSVKVWDIAGEQPTLVVEKNPRIGVIHCLSACPDLPFVFCMGGDNRENNFKVWDLRNTIKARSTFCSRVGLPADEEVPDDDEIPEEEPFSVAGERRYPSQIPHEMDFGSDSYERHSGARPKKFKKKKGGHLDSKRNKR